VLELADLSRTIIGLGVVLLLMAGVLWLLRRFGPPSAGMRTGTDEHLLVLSSAGSASLVQTRGDTT
jgi:flagellar biogenesis protein FliO